MKRTGIKQKDKPVKTGHEKNIIFHADDFAANEEISRHILDCHTKGALTSLSVLANSAYLEPCMEMLAPYRKEIAVSIHFNLAEGHCLSDPSQVPLLVDERGMFHISFFKVLLLSYTGRRGELKRQIKAEMRAQLERMLPHVDTLRIDSHQHYHMIPLVLSGILEAVEEVRREYPQEPLPVDFVRIPAEPLAPFVRHPEFYATYRPINLIKHIVLHVLNQMDRRLLAPYRSKSAVFFGILLSGKMDLRRVSALLPEFRKIAERKGLPLEVLCHPGGVRKAERLMDMENKDCVEFYTSDGRKIEKNMMRKVKAD